MLRNHFTRVRKTFFLSSETFLLYLFLPFFLPPCVPPLQEVGQSQEVHHLSFAVDEGAEHRGVSVNSNKKRSPPRLASKTNTETTGTSPFWGVVPQGGNSHHSLSEQARASDRESSGSEVFTPRGRQRGGERALPAGGEGHSQHADAFALALVHQVVVLLHLLVGLVGRHLQPVVQLAAATLWRSTGPR